MDIFTEKYKTFLSEFGKARKAVLSTSDNNIVSSRMMSVVSIDGEFYFQTDVSFRKYRQIISNPHAALCSDNIQIEGVCGELGCPSDNAAFCMLFRECFRGSYDAYTELKNERLFIFRPTYAQRWIYKQNIPYVETFDVTARTYRIGKYIGE